MLRVRLRSSALGALGRSLWRGGRIVSPVEEPPLRWIGGGVRFKGTGPAAKDADKKASAVAGVNKKVAATSVQALEMDVLCDCGKPAVLKTSKVKNPGLRYLCCAESVPWFRLIKLDSAEKSKQRCKFFSWIDQPDDDEETKAVSGKKSKAAASGSQAQTTAKPEGVSNAAKTKTVKTDKPAAAAKKTTEKKALPVKDQPSSNSTAKTAATKPAPGGGGANKTKAAATKKEDRAATVNAPVAEKAVKEPAKRKKTKTVAPPPPEENDHVGAATKKTKTVAPPPPEEKDHVGAATKKTRSKKNAGGPGAANGAANGSGATETSP